MSAAWLKSRAAGTLMFGIVTVVGGACNPPPDVLNPPPGVSTEEPPPGDVGTQNRELLVAAGQSLVAGAFHTCALLEGGLVSCWGDNSFGQLGHGTSGGQTQADPLEDFSSGREMFVNLGTGRTAKALSAGNLHTCAILDNDQLKCWGWNDRGQLGQGDTLPRGTDSFSTDHGFVGTGMGDALAPINLGTGRTAKAVSAGSVHTCAILDTNQVKCWGVGEPARLGYGDNLDRGSDPGQMGDFLPVVDLGTGRTATKIVTSNHNTCVILDNNHVKCWGFAFECALGKPGSGNIGDGPMQMGDNNLDVDIGVGRTATAIAAGAFHFCVLRDNGTVKCWGENTSGQIGVGTFNNWGCLAGEMGDNGILQPFGAGIAVTAVAAGVGHSCAMRSNGEARCWGNNMNSPGSAKAGQLGINTSPPNNRNTPPTSSIVNVTARALSGGGYHTCAITTTNKARCWGSNEFGQLGTNITDPAVGDVTGDMSLLQDSDLGTRRVAQVVAGADSACAILGAGPTGAVKCWGYNGDGNLGVGDTLNRGDDPGETGNGLPTLSLGTGRTGKWLAAGNGHTCAVLDNNTLKCWGRNDMGQLGMGNFTTLLSPSATAINLGTGRTAHATVAFPVAGGSSHTCIILDNSQIKCWGENTDGQLGYGDTTLRTSPAATTINLGTSRSAKAVATGNSYTCAMLDTNQIKCWGRNDDGQHGYGDSAIRLAPPATTTVNLGTGRSAKALAIGGTTTCALLDNNTVKCWGYNGSGQLGLGDTTPRLSPPSTAIDLGTGQTALSIDVGNSHVCAVLATNQVKCWGQNDSGQLGTWQDKVTNYDTTIGETANEMGNFLATVYQGAGRAVKAVTGGFSHTCFLLDSNQVRCSGTNFAGQLGQGNTNFYSDQFQGAGLVDLGPNP
jgi:alpha-tubulin suppressor-like RCC1 family protein